CRAGKRSATRRFSPGGGGLRAQQKQKKTRPMAPISIKCLHYLLFHCYKLKNIPTPKTPNPDNTPIKKNIKTI
ncbi:hypothetical protein ACVGX7_00445, partial [Enterobacter hormaechei]